MPDSENTAPVTTPFVVEAIKLDPAMTDEQLTDVLLSEVDLLANAAPITAREYPDILSSEENFKAYLDQHLVIETDDKAFQQKFNALKAEMIEELAPVYYSGMSTGVDSYYRNTNSSREPKQNVAKTGDPVNLFDGNFEYETTDFVIPGAGMDFQFTRSYSQFSTANGVLGFRWDHRFNLWIRLTADPDLIFRSNGALREIKYRRHAVHDYWFAAFEEDGIILQKNGQFVWRTADGIEYWYKDQFSGWADVHVIERMEDRYGNYIQFTYNDTLLQQAEINNPDRLVSLFYDNEKRIRGIRDFTGREWTYHYDDMGDLVAVATPATEDFKNGLVTRYEYSSYRYSTTDQQHLLERIMDASGQIFLENEYGTAPGLLSFNRVVRQQQGGGVIYLEYEDIIQPNLFPYPLHEMPAHQTIETNRSGQQKRYLFNSFGNMIFREEYIRVDGVPRLAATHFRYNIDGNLTGMLSPQGTITQFLYGRDYYNRKWQIDGDYAPGDDSNLFPSERQAFNRLLATVKRGKYYSLSQLNTASGLWSGDIFPDIFDVSEDDIIQKFQYENEFGQILHFSDPRFTKSPDPGFSEDGAYTATLTKHVYQAGNNFQNFLLQRIEYPIATAPDGSLIPQSIEKYLQYDNRGRIIQTEDAAGLVTETELYSSGPREGMPRKITVDPSGLHYQTEMELDALGRTIQIRYPRYFESMDDRFTLQQNINALSQVTEAISASHIKSTWKYNKTGNISKHIQEVRDFHNHPAVALFLKTEYFYDQEFRLVKKKEGTLNDALYRVEKNVFDAANRPFLTISPTGRKTKTVYNERDLAYKEITDHGGFGIRTRKYYDADGRLTRLIDSRGGVHRMTYDALGRLLQYTNPEENITCFSYDKSDNVLTERFFEKLNAGQYVLKTRKEFHFDELGRMKKAGTNLFEENHAAVSNPITSYIDSGPGTLLESRFFFDPGGRIVKTIDASDREHATAYDVLGRAIRKTDPYGNELFLTYDAESNVIREDIREVIKDENNAITGQRFFAASYLYDAFNRMIQGVDSLGNLSQFEYDSRGMMTRTLNPLHQEAKNEYDVFGRLKSNIHVVVDPANPASEITLITTYTHDLDDLITSQVDPSGRLTQFRYNSIGMLQSTVLPDGTIDENQYDFAGLLRSYKDRNGLKHIYSRDLYGRLTHHETDVSGLLPQMSVGGATVNKYHYDSLGRMIKMENDYSENEFSFNSLGWNTRETSRLKPFLPGISSNSRSLERAYNNNGSLNGFIYPSGRHIVYRLDMLDRVQSITQVAEGQHFPGDPNMPATILSIAYEGLQRKSLQRSNGAATRYTYDAGARLIGIHHTLNNSGMLNMQFLYDAAGNMRTRTEQAFEFQSTSNYEYDAMSQLRKQTSLAQAQFADTGTILPYAGKLPAPIPHMQGEIDNLFPVITGSTHIFHLDPNGNRKAVASMPSGNVENYTLHLHSDQYDSVDSVSFAYDHNGNLTNDGEHQYTYDFRNQLVKATRLQDNAIVLSLYYDALGRMIVEEEPSAIREKVYAGINCVEEYENGQLVSSRVIDSGIDNYVQVSTNGQNLYHLTDIIKSTRIILNQDQKAGVYAFDAFGRVQPFVNNGAAYLFQGKKWFGSIGKYDFYTRWYDPRLGRFVQKDIKGFIDGTNPYTFVDNNPLNNVDPYGTESRPEQKQQADDDGGTGGIAGGAGLGLSRITPHGPTVPLDDRTSARKLKLYREAAITDRVLGRQTQTEPVRKHATQAAAKRRFLQESANRYDPRRPGRGMNRFHIGHLFDLQHWIGDINNPKHRAYIEMFEWESSSGRSATGNTSLGSSNKILQQHFPAITGQQLLQGGKPPTVYGWAARAENAGRWFHDSRLRTGFRWGGRALAVYGAYSDARELYDTYQSGDAGELSELVTEKSGAWLMAGKGALIGGKAGLFCGPAAWICTPVGGFVGGAVGYVAGSKIGRGIGKAASFLKNKILDLF